MSVAVFQPRIIDMVLLPRQAESNLNLGGPGPTSQSGERLRLDPKLADTLKQ